SQAQRLHRADCHGDLLPAPRREPAVAVRLRLLLVALLLLASPASAETFAGGVVAGASTTAANACRGFSETKITVDPPTTAGLEASWEACRQAGGCHLFVPEGVYEDVALTYDDTWSGAVCFEGAGRGKTVLRAIVA